MAAGAKPAAAKPPRPLLVEPGTRVEHYEIIRAIGRGGMGEVHLARDVRLGRLVALKFLIPSSPEVARTLLIEARATAKCRHENIVVIHDMNEYRGMPYLVLEYLEGKSLHRMHAEAPLPVVRIIEVMIAVLRALDHAHRAGIVHRDLKPDNIFLTTTGTVKVLDFGIAKLVGSPAGHAAPTPEAPAIHDDQTVITVSSNGPVGTRPYMAPEQWLGDAIDHRTDIWAVGVILFRLVTGKFPFELDGAALMYAVASPNEPVRSVRSVIPDFHAELTAIIDRCLCKARDDRFGTARELLEALELLLPRHGPATDDDRCPYPGLMSFQEADAERFFGRDDQIARVLGRLATQPLISIVGPSGVGKSSFVRAGLVPALKREGPWATIALRPGRSPLRSLAALSDPASGNDPERVHAIAQHLFTEPGYLGAVLRWRAASHGCRVLLYIDQFEELYALVHDPGERAAFVACLRAAADDPSSPVRVVVSLRSDFLDRAAEDRAFMASLTEGMHYLMPLGKDGLRQALVRPAEQAGHGFESEELVNRMVDDVATAAGALPLLQFAAARMWEARDRPRRLMTTASYLAMGGIAGALAVHADAVLAELSPGRRRLAQAVFQRLVTADGTRAIVDLDELVRLAPDPDEVCGLLDLLVAARLLVSKSDDQGVGASVELIHESLITAWPQLSQWAEAGREEAAFLVQLRQVAQQWEARGGPPGLLWRGEAAEEARRFAARLGDTLGSRERRFLDSVIAHATRASRIKRLAVVATMVVLAGLVMVGLVVVIWVHRAEQEALRQADEAREARANLAGQLKLVEDKEAARAEAERQAQEAARKEQEAARKAQEAAKDAAAAGEDAQLSRAELQRANQHLTEALDAAHKANDQERALREKVERLLNEERQRNDALAKQRNKMATQLR
ncbi:MAG TPA: serine/threonine-protein kinase [Kofleriaceae bacterium]|nr:serine/threonine-protein kinase [Kofleriaceae bacterium]